MFERFYTLFLGIILGAFPFLFLGVIIATVIQLYSRASWYEWILKRSPIVSHFLIGIFGLFIPICECGNIPVLKKMLNKGFSFSHGVTFLLAAPIVNPVTIITTYQAFKYYPFFSAFRIVGGLVIAIGIGLIFSLNKMNNHKFLLTKEATIALNQVNNQVCKIEGFNNNFVINNNIRTNFGVGNNGFFTRSLKDIKKRNIGNEKGKLIGLIYKLKEQLKSFSLYFVEEFVNTINYLIIGAFLAASLQTLIPQQWLNSVGQNPIYGLLALILFSFVISVCSNVDAFIGLSFIQNFSVNSILGFLVFGPMIDIKTLSMIRNIFTLKFSTLLTLMVLSSTVLLVSIYYFFNTFNIY